MLVRHVYVASSDDQGVNPVFAPPYISKFLFVKSEKHDSRIQINSAF